MQASVKCLTTNSKSRYGKSSRVELVSSDEKTSTALPKCKPVKLTMDFIQK